MKLQIALDDITREAAKVLLEKHQIQSPRHF